MKTKTTSSSSSSSQRHVSDRLRYVNYIILFTIFLFASFFILAPGIWVTYKSVFQLSLLGYGFMVVGIYVATMVIINSAMYYLSKLEKQGITTIPETLKKDFELLLYQSTIITRNVFIVVAILMSLVPLYNLFYITINSCPQHASHPHHWNITHNNVNDNKIHPSDGKINIMLSYLTSKEDGEKSGHYYPKREIIIGNYDIESKKIHIETKRKKIPSSSSDFTSSLSSSEPLWYIIDGHENHGNDEEEEEDDFIVLKEGDYNEHKKQRCKTHLCLTKSLEKSKYLFLEEEIKDLLKYRLEEHRKRKSFVTTSSLSKSTDTETEFEIENNLYIDLFTKCICRNEYVFTIFLISAIILFDLILIIAFIYNIWLYRQRTVQLKLT